VQNYIHAFVVHSKEGGIDIFVKKEYIKVEKSRASGKREGIQPKRSAQLELDGKMGKGNYYDRNYCIGS